MVSMGRRVHRLDANWASRTLTESKTVDEEIERQILEGLKDKQGNQRMPPFKQKLSADDVKLLVGWVKTLRVTK
jgi:mono/diheme cytochrome c family protein